MSAIITAASSSTSVVPAATEQTLITEDTRAAVLDAEADDPAVHCLVCYSEISYTALTPCDHNEICAVCHLRIRYLLRDAKCPICKTPNEQIIVDVDSCRKDRFEEYPLWGNDLGSDFYYHDGVGMFFPVQYYEREIQPLFGYHCTVLGCGYTGLQLESMTQCTPAPAEEEKDAAPGENEDENDPELQQQNRSVQRKSKKTPVRALQDHLRKKHRLALCQLCVDHNRDFVARLPRFTPTQLKKHLSQGDGFESGFSGHPVCEFCRPTRYYDVTHLHQHLLKEHYKCHICDQSGLHNQFFRDYQHLERHFDRQHFLCHDVQCMQARFVVFANEIDLRHHEISIHGATSTGNTKIQLEFRVRRTGTAGRSDPNQQLPTEEDFNYGLDGEAFVPDALPAGASASAPDGVNGSGGGTGIVLHPLHVQRTAQLRERAAQIHAASQPQTEAFPTLGESKEAEADDDQQQQQQQDEAFRIGWTSGQTLQRVGRNKKNAGAVTEEDFPSLPTSSKNRVSKTLRSGLGPATGSQRQFAAMTAAARAPAATVSHATALAASTAAAAAAAAAPSWGTAAASTSRSAPAAAVAAAAPTTASAAVSRNLNDASNLTAENFPSLGRGSGRGMSRGMSQPHRYSAAEDLASRLANNANNFPSLGGTAANRNKKKPPPPPPQQQKPPPQAKPPPLDSEADFPAPISSAAAAAAARPSVRQRLLEPTAAGGSGGGSGHRASGNVLSAVRSSIPVNKDVRLDDMKASLGSARYKQLKNLTKQFVTGDAQPGDYVDRAAKLFDQGSADDDFWSFLPALMAGSPNQAASDEGLKYMETLRGGPSQPPPPPPAAPVVARAYQAPVSASIPGAANNSGPGGGSGSKGKTAWGGAGGVSSTVKNARAGSVAAAAANARPVQGTATKYMAKQSKQQQSANSSLGKKKKNKQKDELRQLAYGR